MFYDEQSILQAIAIKQGYVPSNKRDLIGKFFM